MLKSRTVFDREDKNETIKSAAQNVNNTRYCQTNENELRIFCNLRMKEPSKLISSKYLKKLVLHIDTNLLPIFFSINISYLY